MRQLLTGKFEETILKVGIQTQLAPELGVIVIPDNLFLQLISEKLKD